MSKWILLLTAGCALGATGCLADHHIGDDGLPIGDGGNAGPAASDLSAGGGGDLGGVDLAGFDLPLSAEDMSQSVVTDLATGFGDLGGFCGDPNSPRIQLNNMLANTPAVVGSLWVLNCCDAAALEWDSTQIAHPITLLWRHQVGQGPNPPVVLDLASLPAGWTVTINSDCNPVVQPNCVATDSYTAGFTGTLTIDAYRNSTVCAQVNEGGNPHPVIHNLLLWTPPVAAH
jgi:hypothetical protein